MPSTAIKFTGWRYYDWILPAVVLILVAVGLAAIYSVDLSRGPGLGLFPVQVLALAIGVTGLLIAARLHVSFYRTSAGLLYLAANLLLLLVLFFGRTIRGTTGWFQVGPLSFQPTEAAKAALILFLAWLIDKQARRFDQPQFLVRTGLVTLLPVILLLLQPDLGSAIVFGSLWFGLLLLTGTKKRFLFLLAGLLGAVFLLGWFGFFADYQKERFITFLQPEADPLGAGYNVRQSMIAIGAGRWWGRGLGFGSQSQLHFLPEAQTDFIFSVIAEELGLLGSLLVLALYGLLLWRLLIIARGARDDFGGYVVLGIIMLFLLQIVFNIGAAIGLLPVTGLTLPFLSYGGSSLVVNLFLIGLAERLAHANAERNEDKTNACLE